MASAQADDDALRRVGRVLFRVLLAAENRQVVALSDDCKRAVQITAETGAALHHLCVQELERTGALAYCATRVSISELNELRHAIGAAVVSSSAGSADLMALWSTVYATTRDALSDHYEKVTEAGAAAAAGAVVDVKENAAVIGRLLLFAFQSSMSLSSAVSLELQDAVKAMVERGTPLASELMREVRTHAAAIAKSLPPERLLELRARCSESIVPEWSAIEQFASHVESSAARIADSPVVGAVQKGAVEVYNSPLTKLVVAEGVTKVGAAFTESRERVESAITAMASGVSIGACSSLLASLPPLLRFEILRDFCQTVSLFFTNLYSAMLDTENAPVVRSVQVVFRAIYDVAAANFSALWSANQERLIDVGYVLLLTLIGLGYACFLWFAIAGRHLHKRSDEIRHGHEGTTWAQLAQTQQTRVKAFTWVITACLTIYLPLTRLSVEIVVAAIAKRAGVALGHSSSSGDLVERYGSHPIWPFLQALAVVLLVTFTLPLPLLLVRAIAENRPTGSLEDPLVTYDLDGERVPFDEKVYARLVANDPAQLRCPYRSLYAGFESKWSYYKVLQLIFKVALILPLVSVPQTGVRGVLSASIYSVIVLVTSYSTPFSDPLNNLMEISGKLAALVTCVGGAVLGFSSANASVQRIVGIGVNLVNAVNLVFMLGVFLFGMKPTRQFIKNRLGTLTFSDTTRGLHDAPAKHIVPHWDLEKEAKHRMWQAFWKSVLLSLKDESVVQRFNTLEQAVLASGIHNIRRHWEGQSSEYVAHMRMAARLMLEGVDVYWNDPTGARDGRLDSMSCFGKMYIQPYPFHCVMVYDDAKDEAIIRDDKFSDLLFANFSPPILRKRLLRQRLRALSACGVQIHFPFSRQETVTVEDGTVTRTVTDSQGHTTTRTETRYTTVAFTCHYTLGVISVRANSKDHVMADGFAVLMTYRDGHGDAVAPHTGKTHHQTNRVAAMGPEHIGLTHEFLESPQLQHILTQTQAHWVPALDTLQREHHAYRQQLIAKHSASNQVLGDGFWFFVFNNPYLTRSALERYLRTEESSPVLKSLVETKQPALDFLYARMNLIHSHPAIKFWFVFWEDVFARNGDMARLQPFKSELDPLMPTSICYRAMKREELESWLGERKLRGKPLSLLSLLLLRKSLFHDKLIQLLYEQMHRYTTPNELPTATRSPVVVASNKVQPIL